MKGEEFYFQIIKMYIIIWFIKKIYFQEIFDRS